MNTSDAGCGSYTERVSGAGVSEIEKSAGAARAWWLVAGALLLGGVAAMSLWSGHWSPDRPPAARPLHWLFVCYMISWAGYALSYRLAMPHPKRAPLLLIVAVGLLARLILLPSALIQSDDCYRYILDGQSLLAGLNPYASAPDELKLHPPPQLLGDRATAAWDVLGRVNNAEVPTIYPPLALATFAAGAALIPWQIMGQRLVMLGCDLLCALLLLVLLHRLGKPKPWIVVYLWNPLVIKEVANSAHVDGLAALWLVVLTATTLRCGASRGASLRRDLGGAVLAGVAAGGAILAKLYPVLLLPCCLMYVARGRRWFLKAVIMSVAAAAVVLICYWPFLGVGFDRITAGLRTYSEHWINNAGAFSLLQLLTDSPRTLANSLLVLASLLSALVVWRSRAQADGLIQGLQVTLLMVFLLPPTCLPWYVIGLLAISVLRPRGWCVVLTGALGLFYMLRYLDYQGWPDGWLTAVRTLEHGIVWLSVTIALLRGLFAMKRAPAAMISM